MHVNFRTYTKGNIWQTDSERMELNYLHCKWCVEEEVIVYKWVGELKHFHPIVNELIQNQKRQFKAVVCPVFFIVD